ncbi:MAG: FISUMP domain-containing protein [Ignavibacteriaceae bacterium]|nr:FISUMP domain-containing protein [Ignavibacteriaceae bacterium]
MSVFLLFLTAIPSSAQTAHLSKIKSSSTNSLKKETTLNLTLTALIEAMYVTGRTAMSTTPEVTVELHNASTLEVVESKTATLSTEGVGSFLFTTVTNGTPYYIVVKSLTTVEIWSAAAHSFIADTLSYDFTSGVGQAYTDGSMNPMGVHSGKACIYSGDVNQDGQVTSDDFTGVDNDNSNFDYHIANDVNGDGQVTSDDFTWIDNNNTNFVAKQVPTRASSDSLSYAGQTYHIVQIGSQYWLKENLNVGTRIDGGVDQTGIGPDNINKYCYMDQDDNCNIYGGLYQWNEAMQFSSTEKAQGICPNDWHIPTLSEFNTLINTVNNDNLALIEIGQGNGTNTSGFSALTEPYFLYFSSDFWMFYDGDYSSNFWSSTSTVPSEAYEMYFYNASSSINLTSIGNKYGFAVRCVKN